MGHASQVRARIIAASIGLAIVCPPAATLSQTSAQASAQRWSAVFVDCAGNYALVSATTGSVERRGRVQLLSGARLPPAVRDGCAVDDLKVGDAPSHIVLTVQNFMWEAERRNPAYARLTLRLSDLRILNREPLRKLPPFTTIRPELSPLQRAFTESVDSSQRRPFANDAIMLSSDGRTALVAELTPGSSWVGLSSVFVPGMRIVSADRMPLTGRFAAYDVDTKTERARYEIPGLQTDLHNKTLIAPDGSCVFHAHNSLDGRRKLFLVKLSPAAAKLSPAAKLPAAAASRPPMPAAEVVEVAYGDLDPWWLGGVIAPDIR